MWYLNITKSLLRNHNGKFPTATIPQITNGIGAQKYNNPARQTRYGRFWDQNMVLTSEKQARKEQSENRRHTSDCPKPT